MPAADPRLVRLCVLNGVRSAPRFMERLKDTLSGILEAQGLNVRARVLFPYDDWHRRLLPQLREARYDIMLPYRKYGRSIGGMKTIAALEADRAEGTRGREIAVFVGHSAGGVAAVHAAGLLLAREGGPPSPVVMIGSPKCRIPQALRDSVLYVQAERMKPPSIEREPDRPERAYDAPGGRTSDPVCRIGSFGGWSRDAGRLLPGWRADRHAPGARAAVRIVGGHADYFREGAIHAKPDGRTNMEETIATILPWLNEQLAERLER
ncbi:hypothetical protein [Cohnella sp. JJ-181]|uniref:hypothetical protein n=1 Tax=Cohnella rhizoplanae TaxID=2974897 RepID=UPI00232B66DA|nr:hypothetical protein [Cohnella sp. JJ-181]